MSEPLNTLVGACQYADEIRKSRFLAQAMPVADAEHALAFLREVNDPTATHHCWAYRIGQDYRFNDDGEPGGTAGRPILQAIDGQRMDCVMVVVKRWYGGTKLGAGGLMRAYGGTAAECLRRAEQTPIVLMARLQLRCDFTDLALLKARLKELGAEIEQENFNADGVELRLRLPELHVADAQARITDISRGRSIGRRIE